MFKDKEKERAYLLKWRIENRAKVLASKRKWQAAWRKANLEKARERDRNWSAANKEQVLTRVYAWQTAHPDKRREHARNYQRKRYAKEPEMAREYARQWYSEWCKNNPELARQIRRDKYTTRRLEVLSAYGGKCACCGETQPEFLTIDHINNDGAKHRREIGAGGTSLYGWLKKNKYPKDGFQLLCWNCNCAKRTSGSCPHNQREAKAC